MEHHLRPSQLSQKGEMPTQRAVYRFFRSLGDQAIDTLYLSLADYLAARGPQIEREEWKDYTKVIRHALETGLHQEEEVSSPRLVDGHEVMDALGLKTEGPMLGKVLNVVEEAQATGEIGSRKEALALAREVALAGRYRKATMRRVSIWRILVIIAAIWDLRVLADVPKHRRPCSGESFRARKRRYSGNALGVGSPGRKPPWSTKPEDRKS